MSAWTTLSRPRLGSCGIRMLLLCPSGSRWWHWLPMSTWRSWVIPQWCQESTWLYLLIAWGCASEGRMREGRWEERLGWRGEILGGIGGGLPDEPKPMVE